MRLIDADSLLESISAISDLKMNGVTIAVAVAKCVTIDAVPVVRCRECKYWGDEDGKLQDSDGVLFARCKIHNYLLDGRHTGWCPKENDFCSYGERKEGAEGAY